MNIPWGTITAIAKAVELAVPVVADVARRLGCILTDCPDAALEPADIPREADALEDARAKAVAKAQTQKAEG